MVMLFLFSPEKTKFFYEILFDAQIFISPKVTDWLKGIFFY